MRVTLLVNPRRYDQIHTQTVCLGSWYNENEAAGHNVMVELSTAVQVQAGDNQATKEAEETVAGRGDDGVAAVSDAKAAPTAM